MKSLLAGFVAAMSLLSADFDWNLPKGFPRPVVPAGNPMSAVKVELGRYLFYDKRISVNGKQSCASCHRQELAFTDGRAKAEGTTGQAHSRGTMSLVNVAYAPALTWANPELASLEEQALIPMLGEHPVELGLKGREREFLAVVRGEPVYSKLFPQAFPGESDVFSLVNICKAIAAFERTIISMRSPYDRYRWGDDRSAISDAAKRGELLFFSSERAGCFQCHAGWNFSGRFFDTGIAKESGKFRAPTLRNVAVTAPYMHDGSVATLEDVIDRYAAGGKVRAFTLTDGDKRDLIEFLKSLTEEGLLRDPRWSNPW